MVGSWPGESNMELEMTGPEPYPENVGESKPNSSLQLSVGSCSFL